MFYVPLRILQSGSRWESGWRWINIGRKTKLRMIAELINRLVDAAKSSLFHKFNEPLFRTGG
jgi:hypothetical protein